MKSTRSKPKKLAHKEPMALTRRRRGFKFMEHTCCEECSVLERALIKENPTKFRVTEDSILKPGESPFIVPLYLEFKRKNEVAEPCGYLSPCGVELDDYESIYSYLKVTKSRLNVNQFVLTTRIELFRDRPDFEVFVMKKDIANGLEATPIQAINQYEAEICWDKFVYMKERQIPIDSGLVEDDHSKRCGCSCKGDCSDPEECECRLLTVKENEVLKAGNKANYEFNYLPRLPKTAIYECRSSCSCKRDCLNRVVQNGIKIVLQVYKTSKRGWGVRCLHDIPKGTFVCSYEGNVVKNTKSELEKANMYLMNLDYDYHYDQLKDGENSTDDKKNEANDGANDQEKDGETVDKNEQKVDGKEQLENQNSVRQIDEFTDFGDSEYSSSDTSFSDLTEIDLSDYSSSECDPSENFDGCGSLECGEGNQEENSQPEGQQDDRQTKENGESTKKKLKSDDDCDYLMDSRDFSNVSRFLNHSCNPNLDCQPVFIESRHPVLTHMAFFANRDIKAFSELTFNYFFGNPDNMNFDCRCKSRKCVRKTRSVQ